MTANSNGFLRWKIAAAVGVTLGAVACGLYTLGESPLTAARRVEAVNVLMNELAKTNASLAELRAEVAELKRK